MVRSCTCSRWRSSAALLRSKAGTSGKVRRALRAAPALDRVLGEGDFVRVTGHVRIEKHFIHAPLSDRRCVAYCARAIPAPRVLRDYPPFEEWKMVSFVIEREDKTRVAIDCAYVKLLIPPLPLRPGSDERCAELGRTRKLAARALKKMQYEEIVVMEDMRVSVAGILVKDAARSRPGRARLSRRADVCDAPRRQRHTSIDHRRARRLISARRRALRVACLRPADRGTRCAPCRSRRARP